MLQRIVGLLLVALITALSPVQAQSGETLLQKYGFNIDLAVLPNIENFKAIIVTEVVPGGKADLSGISVGDLIRESDLPRPFKETIRIRTDNATYVQSQLKDALDGRGFAYFYIVDDVASFWEYSGQEVVFPLMDVAEHLGMRADATHTVTEVYGNSPAAEAGLQAGDLIVGFGTVQVSPQSEARILSEAMERVTEGFGTVPIRIERAGETMVLELPTRGMGEDF